MMRSGLALRLVVRKRPMLNPMGRLMNAGLKMLDLRTLPFGGSRHSRARLASLRWRVACGHHRQPRRLFWRAVLCRTGRRRNRCRCPRTSPLAGHSAVATQCDASLRRLAPTSTHSASCRAAERPVHGPSRCRRCGSVGSSARHNAASSGVIWETPVKDTSSLPLRDDR